MIDCHSHLAGSDFDADRYAVRRRAKDAGVQAVLVVGEDAEDNARVLRVIAEVLRVDNEHAIRQVPPAPRAPVGARLVPCLGFHPDRFADELPLPTRTQVDEVISQIRAHAGELAAIGEVGLDYWYVKDPERRRAQGAILEEMAALSQELGLPLNVHSRSAGHYTVDLLLAAGAERVLMHAFDGKASHALRVAEAGYLFSVPPSVVRSEQKQKLVRRLPLESLALESDSPVLGPERDQRNEPANLTYARDFIAEAHGLSPERVDEVTSANARRLFLHLAAR
ncbi:MAG: TatD family hydrolase [Pseudomonadota bacterium]|nr:TatD family hydrolase [Pseudomonadota bacterium]